MFHGKRKPSGVSEVNEDLGAHLKGQSQGYILKHAFENKLINALMPNSKIRLSWDVFIFMAILYNSLVTPIRLFIIPSGRTPIVLINADVVFDFIFVIDTLLHFYRPYIDEDTGQSVDNTKQIAAKYRGSISFYINIIACIPILKAPLSIFLNEDEQNSLSTYSNILRMIRILHFSSQFRELKRYQAQKGPVNEPIFRMWIILFFTFLLMSIFGCVYFGVATLRVDNICPDSKNFASVFDSAEMWVADDHVITNVMDPSTCPIVEYCNPCPQMLFFFRSIYFLMQTLFTIGYGDTVVPSRSTAEVIMACIFVIFGVFGYGLIIANMTSVLSNLDVVNMRFRHEMDNLSKWLKVRCAPETLKAYVQMHFTYLTRSQYGMLDEEIYKDLPPQLSREFSQMSRKFIAKVPFFNSNYRSDIFLDMVAKVMKRRVYPPGSFILYEGEIQRELVIVMSGRLDICIKGIPKPIGTLIVGDYLGDYQLLFGTVNQIGLRSPDFSEVLVLTFDSFEQILKMPEIQDIYFPKDCRNFRFSTDKGVSDTIKKSKE